MHNTSPLQVERPLVQYWCWNVKECGRPARGEPLIFLLGTARRKTNNTTLGIFFWQILNISRIFVGYFWNISRIPQQARQLSRLLPNILATVLSRWRQTNSRHDLWAERQSILTSCFSFSISLANQNLVWADPLLAFPPALNKVSKKNLSCWTDVPKTINGLSFWCWLLKGDDTAHFLSFDSSFDEKVRKHLFFLCAIPDLLAVEMFAWIIEERATR